MNGARVVVPLCVLSVAMVLAVARSAYAATEAVIVPHGVVTPGAVITVALRGWSPGTITVGTCGNAARRGSQDCALQGDVAVAIRRGVPAAVNLTVEPPPVPCPCVVRATTATGDVVRTAPIRIQGVPNGPVLTDAASARELVAVTARVDDDRTWSAPVVGALAGPSRRTLVLSLRNRGDVTLDGLTVSGRVGRTADDGTPFTAPALPAIAPGDVAVVRVPIALGAPAFGRYTVSGAVYGLAAPASFRVNTSNDPWLLELLPALALLAFAQVLRARARTKARNTEVISTTDWTT